MTAPITGYRLACPGVGEYGHGLTARTVHLADCCGRFAAADAAEQEKSGLRIPLALPNMQEPCICSSTAGGCPDCRNEQPEATR